MYLVSKRAAQVAGSLTLAIDGKAGHRRRKLWGGRT